MFRTFCKLLVPAAAALLLAACNSAGTGGTPGGDPFAGLPAPTAGVPAQGVFASRGEVKISVNGVRLDEQVVAVSADLHEEDGIITGYLLVRGLDGNDYPILVSGENDGGKVTMPINAFLCNREVNVTLYATITEGGTITAAGHEQELECFGQTVSFSVPEFTITSGGEL